MTSVTATTYFSEKLKMFWGSNVLSVTQSTGNSLSATEWRDGHTTSHFITQTPGLLFSRSSLAAVGGNTTDLACQSTLKAGLYFIVNCFGYHAVCIHSHSASVLALNYVPVSQPH